MKPTKVFILTFFIFFNSVLYAQKYTTLKSKIETLGDDKIYLTKPGCDDMYENCNFVPYEYETEWFWLDKEEKLARRARNIARRNEWLAKKSPERDQWFKENHIVIAPTEAKIKVLSKEKKALTRAIASNKQKVQSIDKSYQQTEEKLKKLRQRYTALQAKKKKLSSKALTIIKKNPNIIGGETGVLEDVEDMFNRGTTLQYGKVDKKDLQQLGSVQYDLRNVIKDMQSLDNEITNTTFEGRQAQHQLTQLQKELQRSQTDLKQKSQAYGRAYNRLKDDKKKQQAYLQALTLKNKQEAAVRYAEAKMKDLENASDFAAFLMRDYDSLQKDLKINKLETSNLLSRVNNRIQKSILGQYIQTQMEKTLETALSAACQSAKACAEHQSIDNSPRQLQKQIDKAVQELRKSTSSSVGR